MKNDKLKIGILFLVVALVLGAVLVDQVVSPYLAQRGGNPPITRTPSNTPPASGVPTLPPPSSTPTPQPPPATWTATADPGPDFTATPTLLPPTVTPTVGAPSGSNLLFNGNFSAGFTGWQMVNGRFLIHPPVVCDPSITGYYTGSYVEMDEDFGGQWPVGAEDWISQTFTAPEHLTATLVIHESHHQRTAEYPVVTVYGSQDGETWTPAFVRVGIDSPWPAGKCSSAIPPARRVPPATNSYVFAGGFPFYRLETYYKLAQYGDGVLLAFEFYVE